MKKCYALKTISLLIILFFLTSCGNYAASYEQSEKGEKQSIKISFDTKHYASNKYYGVALSTLTNNDMPRPEENERWLKSLTINYPQIYNLKDVDKEERINDVLFQEALNIRDVISNRKYIEYNIDYEIMEASDEAISILFTGFSHTPNKANDIIHAVTINIKDERIMNLSEFYKIDKSLLEKLKTKDFVPTEDKISDFNQIYKLVEGYIESYNQAEHLNDFYIRNGTLGLIIPAPQSMNYFILEGKIEEKE